MKNIFISILILTTPVLINAQPVDFYDQCFEPEINQQLRASSDIINSERGRFFPTKGTYRMLVIFVNIIYDVDTDRDANVIDNPWGWDDATQEGINLLPPTQYFRDIFDVNNTLPRQGSFTRLLSECSFDSLVILGDFTSVSIKQSRIDSTGGTKAAIINYINSMGGLNAWYGHNSIEDYDNATFLDYNDIKRVGDGALDYVAFLIRNPTDKYGPVSGGLTGSSSGDTIKLSNGFFPIKAFQLTGVKHVHLKHEPFIIVHEFAHSLLGDNSFHTSGGNHLGSGETSTFMFIQWGNGLFNVSLRSTNAYERWRLGWHHPSNAPYKIAASGVNTNIQSKFTGTQTYYLRDFVTYGDAIRIKLPYKDNAAASNQYIWLENHQLGRNNKMDGLNFHFFPNNTCIPLGTPGIYSYIQVGKDIIEGTSTEVYPTNEKDNLRIISAEGNYNMQYTGKNTDCFGWTNRSTFEYTTPNPISGWNDQTEAINTNNQTLSDYSDVGNKIKQGILNSKLVSRGDYLDAFTSGSIMDISSNPTPINATTYYAQYSGYDNMIYDTVDNERNTRKKYLTGLNIKMTRSHTISGSGDVFKVDIRWDDYDVKQNVNWAGDIVSKEQLNLLSDKTITLEQNLTANQVGRDPMSGFFAPCTKFTCEANSTFTMQPKSKVILKDKSSFIMSIGSSLTIKDGAQIVVEAGCTFIIKPMATLIIEGSGKLIIKPGAYLCVEPGAIIRLQQYNSVIAMLPNAVYGANPQLFANTSCQSPISFYGDGCIPNYNQDVYIQNTTITTNRYIGGKNIYVGKSVTSSITQGGVIIDNNSNVIFDAIGETVISPGFESKLGSTFEIRK